MSGVANPNLATHFQAPAGQRATVPGADFAGGMNLGGSNAPGIGINTGDYSPKPSDWSEDVRLEYESGQLGQATDDILASDTGTVSFLLTLTEIAVDAQIDLTGYYNQTGVIIPALTWVWATSVDPAP